MRPYWKDEPNNAESAKRRRVQPSSLGELLSRTGSCVDAWWQEENRNTPSTATNGFSNQEGSEGTEELFASIFKPSNTTGSESLRELLSFRGHDAKSPGGTLIDMAEENRAGHSVPSIPIGRSAQNLGNSIPKRFPDGPNENAKRFPDGPNENAKRFPDGFNENAKRFPDGPNENAKRFPDGPNARRSIVDDFARLGLRHASCIQVGSEACKRLYEEVASLEGCVAEELIESTSLQLVAERSVLEERAFRAALYRSIFVNPNSENLQIERVTNFRHPAVISKPTGSPVYTLRFRKGNEDGDDDEKGVGEKEPRILGTLWGVVRDLDIEGSSCKGRADSQASHLLRFRTGRDASVSFCPSLGAQQVLDCGAATSAVFFVNHYQSLWDVLEEYLAAGEDFMQDSSPMTPENNSPVLPVLSGPVVSRPNCRFHVVSIKGFPFLVLTSLPGVPLKDGDELFVDKGKHWAEQHLLSNWPRLQKEFTSLRASGGNEASGACAICCLPYEERLAGVLRCDGCPRWHHVSCLLKNSIATPSPNTQWFCSHCRDFASQVMDCAPSSCGDSSQPAVLIRGDESPLRRLKPCNACISELASNCRNVNVICRLYKGHLQSNCDEPGGNYAQDLLSMAKFIVETVTSSLVASERRNRAIQKQLADLRAKANHPLEDLEEVKAAIDYWRRSKEKFLLYQERQPRAIPSMKLKSKSFIENHAMLRRSTNRPRSPSTELENNQSSEGSEDNQGAASQCRPQFMARSLLRGEFEPYKAAACIDNPVSFNEANATAKRLRPWPRGISWNSKRLTWSVRFWKDDGRTLIATSIPARKHGGVEEAFRKAVALRKKSFIHVLAKTAQECQAGGRELDHLRWSRYNQHWRVVFQNEKKVWPANTEEGVVSSWVAAVQWLKEQDDPAATTIDTETVVAGSAVPRMSSRRSDLSVDDGDEPFQRVKSRRRKDAVDKTPDDLGEESYSAKTVDAETRTQGHANVIASLQPLPSGLIWARTTSRFFAVYRDPLSSSVNKKKRFKTFDPKKFGGTNGAYDAACEFLTTVEPWETKGKAGERNGKRRGRKRQSEIREQPYDERMTEGRNEESGLENDGMDRITPDTDYHSVGHFNSRCLSPAAHSQQILDEIDDDSDDDDAGFDGNSLYRVEGAIREDESFRTVRMAAGDLDESLDDETMMDQPVLSNVDAASSVLPSRGENKLRKRDRSPKKIDCELQSGKVPSSTSASHARLANFVRQIKEEGLYESDDSLADMNEEAKKFEKFSNISWVPQKQAFSVFYTKDDVAHNKTTKAFNPVSYGGVKRAFKQACIFGLQILERKLNALNDDCDDSDEP